MPILKLRLAGKVRPDLGPTVNSASLHQPGDLHLLTLTPFYPSAVDDASGCFVAEPLECLVKRKVRNTVMAVQPIYRAKPRPSRSAAREDWLRYFSLPGGVGLPTAGAFLFARIIPQLRKLHRSQPIDVVHAHGPLPCGHAAMLVARELNIPFVVSVHGLDAFSTIQVAGRSGKWCRRISRSVYSAACRVICISDHVREAVVDGSAHGCRISVVYNGVDPERFAPTQNSPDSLAPKILSVGNLIPIKGHARLLRALASLQEEFPSLELDIIGRGPELARLQSLAAELNLADKVHFLGRKSRDQVAEAMRNCTLFALPSRYEGLGCVYLEAMSCGKPVIACQGQGIAEIIKPGANGFLVAPNEEGEKELSMVMGALLRDPNRRREVGCAARETILAGFTLERQAENLIRIYQECVR